ncbi:MAG: hypothetical protein GY751_02560 [Bacteroidetes bacterium]|nr:hypothetical protein [Bacteroidota bacterium]
MIRLISSVIFIWVLMGVTPVSGQSSMVPFGSETYDIVNRLEIKSGRLSDEFFAVHKPYDRRGVTEFLAKIDTFSDTDLSDLDLDLIDYVYRDNMEWSERGRSYMKRGIFKTFYRHPAAFLHADVPNFQIMLNPVVGVRTGYGTEMAPKQIKLFRTYGFELRGQVDDFFGFYAYVTDNQVIFPEYVRRYVNNNNSVPGAGYYKNYKEDAGFDYFQARGYVTFSATKHVHFQFGYDKNHIGYGYRSLFLSDFGNDYLFFKMNARVWKLNYQTIFAQLVKEYGGSSSLDTNLVRKYASIHHLSWNIGKHFNMGIFEGVVFARPDVFEFQYLNPLIFYRSIEQAIGSPDNAMIGLDFRALIARRISIYGQFLIDELNFGNEFGTVQDGTETIEGSFTKPNRWWGTKFSTQLGIQYVDAFGLDGLDAQVEMNFIRPYTYGHSGEITNWSHYNQPLAHPLQANTSEIISIVRYQPIQEFVLNMKYIWAKYGADDGTPGFSYGQDLTVQQLPENRPDDFGVKIHQGFLTKQHHVEARATYQPWHNLYIDMIYEFRKQKSDLASLNSMTHFISAAVRFNLPHKSYDF